MNCSRTLSLLSVCGVALALFAAPLESQTCFAAWPCTSCAGGYGTASAVTAYTPAFVPRASRRGPGYNLAACVTCKPRTYAAVPQAYTAVPQMSPPSVYLPAQAQSCYQPVTAWLTRPSLVPYISYRRPWPLTRVMYYSPYVSYYSPCVSCYTPCVSTCSPCVSWCDPCMSCGTSVGTSVSGCTSCGSIGAPATTPYYTPPSSPGSAAATAPSLLTPPSSAGPATGGSTPKTFEEKTTPEPQSTLKPIPEKESRNTSPATPKLIDPYSRTTAVPIRQAAHFRPVSTTFQPAASGWRASRD